MSKSKTASGKSEGEKTVSKPAPVTWSRTLRETVESIAIAFILAFLFRTFEAEAFVIPTGSMATTLYGYQKDVKCPQCGYTFPVNCSDEVEKKPSIPIVGTTCPNCRYNIDFAREKMDPSCRSGDRVLVAKCFYDLDLYNPQRLDVVVFKFPESPQVNHSPMNYIKRLIGLPRETIGIFYGKLYRLPPEKGPQHPEDQQVRAEDLWHAQYMHPHEVRELLKQKDSPFEMIRKPPDKILRMMRIVFDNDHQPKDQKDVPPRWAFEKDAPGLWEAAGPSGFRYKASEADQLHFLRYSHILRHGKEPELITDCMGYNSKGYLLHGESRVDHPALPRNWVGDLILECDVTIDSADGELVLELAKGVDRFRATWQLSSGNCALSRLANGKETKLETQPTKLKKKGNYRLRFANVDERLTIWVDSSLPFGDGVIYEAPSDRGPTASDLQPAAVGMKGGAAAFSKIRLFRDTYYTVTVDPSSADARAVQDILFQPPAAAEEEMHQLLSDASRFAKAFGDLPCATFYVQPDHYLCLGDNSPESSDGRKWGLVPKRLLLGRALLVYWPFNRAGTIK